MIYAANVILIKRTQTSVHIRRCFLLNDSSSKSWTESIEEKQKNNSDFTYRKVTDPEVFNQNKLNDFNLPNKFSEILASRLKEKITNPLTADT